MYCSYGTKWKIELKNHIMRKHRNFEDIKWFQCEHCSYKSKFKAYLGKHMLKHTNPEDHRNIQILKM
ncbi:hypothetical protein BDFB_014996, partial [Asbolus verrucosus]